MRLSALGHPSIPITSIATLIEGMRDCFSHLRLFATNHVGQAPGHVAYPQQKLQGGGTHRLARHPDPSLRVNTEQGASPTSDL